MKAEEVEINGFVVRTDNSPHRGRIAAVSLEGGSVWVVWDLPAHRVKNEWVRLEYLTKLELDLEGVSIPINQPHQRVSELGSASSADDGPSHAEPDSGSAWVGRRESSDNVGRGVRVPGQRWERGEPTTLNLSEMLNGDINRLCYVPRYSTTFLIQRENVAEHTCGVSLYCIVLARWVDQNTSVKVQLDKLLLRAAVHDLEEVRSGDLSRTFKHYDLVLKNRLNDVSGELLGETLSRLLPEDEGFVGRIMDAWEHSKDLSPEGRILAFADFLQALSFLSREWRLGNKSVTSPPVCLPMHLTEFDDASFDFLRPLIVDTQNIVNETFTTER